MRFQGGVFQALEVCGLVSRCMAAGIRTAKLVRRSVFVCPGVDVPELMVWARFGLTRQRLGRFRPIRAGLSSRGYSVNGWYFRSFTMFPACLG